MSHLSVVEQYTEVTAFGTILVCSVMLLSMHSWLEKSYWYLDLKSPSIAKRAVIITHAVTLAMQWPPL